MDPGDLLSELLYLLSAYRAGLDPDPQRLAQLKHVQLQALLNQAGCHDPLDTARSVVQALGERHAAKGESNRAFERRSGVNRSTTADLLRHPSPNPKLPTLAKLAVALNYPLVATIQNSLQEQRNPPADAGQLQSAGSVADTQQGRLPVPVSVPLKSKPVAVSHEVGEIGDYYTLGVQPALLGFYELLGSGAPSPSTSNPSVPSTGKPDADVQVAQHARAVQRPVEKPVVKNDDATTAERKPNQSMYHDVVESDSRRRDEGERSVFEPQADIIFPDFEQTRPEPKTLNSRVSSRPVAPFSFRCHPHRNPGATVFPKPMRAEPHQGKEMPEETEATQAPIETPAAPWRHYIFEDDEEPMDQDDDDELAADQDDDALPTAGVSAVFEKEMLQTRHGVWFNREDILAYLDEYDGDYVDGRGSDGEVHFDDDGSEEQEGEYQVAEDSTADEDFEVEEHDDEHLLADASVESEREFEDNEDYADESDNHHLTEDSTESEYDSGEEFVEDSDTLDFAEDSTESEDEEFAEDSDTLDFAEDSTEPEYEEYAEEADAEGSTEPEYAEYDDEVDAEGSTEFESEEADAYHLSDDSTAVDEDEHEDEEYVEDEYEDEDEDEEYVEDEYEADSPEYEEAYAEETHGGHRYGGYSIRRSRARSVADEYRRRGKPLTHAQATRSQPAVDAEPIEKLPRNLQTGAIEKHQPKIAVKAVGVTLGAAVGLSVTGRGLFYTTGAGILTAIAAAYSRDSHARDFMLYSGVSTAVSSISKAIYEFHKKNSK